MRNRICFAIAFAVLCVLPNLAVGQSDLADSQGALTAPIVGTWIVNVHRPDGTAFSALQSFTAGGVTLATGTIDRTPPPPISPLYGSWKRMEENSYAVTLNFFIFDLAGHAVAMFENHETFRLTDDNNIVGTGHAFLCDTNHDNCSELPGLATFTGKRLIAQGA